MTQMKRLQMAMDNNLLAALEHYARAVGLSKAEVVRRCLLAELGPPASQS
jgi:hypothetical protein